MKNRHDDTVPTNTVSSNQQSTVARSAGVIRPDPWHHQVAGYSACRCENHGAGFDAEVLIGTTGHWKAYPDAIRHEQGSEVVRRHRDYRMRFIRKVNVAPVGIEAHADRSERGQGNGLCPLHGAGYHADQPRASNSISYLSMMPIGWSLSRPEPPHAVRSVLVISVVVTPRWLSSAITTSPRATRRLLT